MTKGAILATLYALSIVAAAYLVVQFGAVPVGLGLVAPAGAYMVGISLVLRDMTQDQLGPGWTIAAIVIGAAISAGISPSLALASAAAFLASELLDMAVYTPLRAKGRIVTSILASNIVGTLVDSFIFLWIAFGSLEFFAGQVWAKLVATVLAAGVVYLIHRRQKDRRPAYIKERELAKHPADLSA